MEEKLLWREEWRRDARGEEGVMGEERCVVREMWREGPTEETMKMSWNCGRRGKWWGGEEKFGEIKKRLR